MFLIRDHFDLARVLGSSGLDHLAIAFSEYKGVHESGLDNPSAHEWARCLNYHTMLREIRRRELGSCIISIALFQASMEKIPFFVQGRDGFKILTKTTFSGMWLELIGQLPNTEKVKAETEFNDYCGRIYKNMRNPIIHGREPGDLDKVNEIRAADVHSGIRAGWKAYDCLLTHLYKDHQPSWPTICYGSGVPEILDASDYPDLDKLSGEFIKRYQDGLKAAVEGRLQDFP